jgi:hypothetical protein
MWITSYPVSQPQSGAFTGGTFSYNVARLGGGIHIRNSQIVMSNTTLYKNSAVVNGAGIRTDRSGNPNSSFPLRLDVINSTISANTTGLNGGGIQAFRVNVTILNSTIAFNESTFEANNPDNPNGGGGLSVGGAASFKMRNTIVAGSIGSDCKGSIDNPDVDDSNIIQDGSCATPALAVDPKLQPLTNNGGINQTHELGASSPAIDTGNNMICTDAPTNGLDQRGRMRPDGPSCDIGAVESENRGLDDQFFIIPLPSGKVVVVPL